MHGCILRTLVNAASQELVNDVTTLCMRVLRLQGAHVEQLMNADYEMCVSRSTLAANGTLPCCAQKPLHQSRGRRRAALRCRKDAQIEHVCPPPLQSFPADRLSFSCRHACVAQYQACGRERECTRPSCCQGVLAEGLERRGQVDRGGSGPEPDRRPAEAGPGAAVSDAQNPRTVRRSAETLPMPARHKIRVTRLKLLSAARGACPHVALGTRMSCKSPPAPYALHARRDAVSHILPGVIGPRC